MPPAPFLILIMANNAKRITSPKLAWLDGDRENKGVTLGEAFDFFSKLQGVACDGAINGIKIDADPANPPLRLVFETTAGSGALRLRDCSGAIIFEITGALASASASASSSASLSPSPSASQSPSSSASSSNSPSVSPSPSSSPSASPSPSA